MVSTFGPVSKEPPPHAFTVINRAAKRFMSPFIERADRDEKVMNSICAIDNTDGMNLLHLHYFYVVAEQGGFTKASQALSVRQPALSQMVKQLEESFGFRLLERQARGVLLTQRGRQVFDHARKIFAEVDTLERAMGQISGECAGDLRFAAGEPIASVLVPLAIQAVRARYPKVYPQFTSGPASLLLERVRLGSLEFGAFFHVPDLKEDLLVVEKIPVRFHLVVKKEERRNGRVLRTFVGSREIDDTTTRHFPTLARWQKNVPDASIAISTNSITAHKSLVMLGEGIAVLPRFLIGRELEERVLLDLLPKERLDFDLLVIARQTATLSLNAKALLTALKKSAG